MPTNEQLFEMTAVGLRIEPNESGWRTTIVRQSSEGALHEDEWPTRISFALALHDARACAPTIDMGAWHPYGKWQISACQGKHFALVLGVQRERRECAAQ